MFVISYNLFYVSLHILKYLYIIFDMQHFQHNLHESQFGSSITLLHIWTVIPMYYMYVNRIIIIVIVDVHWNNHYCYCCPCPLS